MPTQYHLLAQLQAITASAMISICYDQEIDCLSLKLRITDGRHGGDEKQISLYESKLSSNKLEENPFFRV